MPLKILEIKYLRVIDRVILIVTSCTKYCNSTSVRVQKHKEKRNFREKKEKKYILRHENSKKGDIR